MPPPSSLSSSWSSTGCSSSLVSSSSSEASSYEASSSSEEAGIVGKFCVGVESREIGEAISVLAYSHCGSTVSVRSFARMGSAISVLNLVENVLVGQNVESRVRRIEEILLLRSDVRRAFDALNDADPATMKAISDWLTGVLASYRRTDVALDFPDFPALQPLLSTYRPHHQHFFLQHSAAVRLVL